MPLRCVLMLSRGHHVRAARRGTPRACTTAGPGIAAPSHARAARPADRREPRARPRVRRVVGATITGCGICGAPKGKGAARLPFATVAVARTSARTIQVRIVTAGLSAAVLCPPVRRQAKHVVHVVA